MPSDLTDFNPADLRTEVETSFARRMLHISRAFNALAQAKYTQRGYAALTPVHTSLLANLELDGIRIVDLAERMGITKQFAGRLVQELVKIDYVTTQPDPDDRRATLVKGTPAGWQFLIDACDVRSEIEELFKKALGESLYSPFAQAIEALADLSIDTRTAPQPFQLLPGQDPS